MSISDSPTNKTKFVFPQGMAIAAGQYMVLFADDDVVTVPGPHLGFSLSEGGEGVFLYDRLTSGGALLDSVEFGVQLPDLSIGRVGQDGHWALTKRRSSVLTSRKQPAT